MGWEISSDIESGALGKVEFGESGTLTGYNAIESTIQTVHFLQGR